MQKKIHFKDAKLQTLLIIDFKDSVDLLIYATFNFISPATIYTKIISYKNDIK